MNALDLFSDIGCHAIGFERAGFKTVAFCESNMWRNSSAIECVKRAADARGDWDPDQLTALRVDARSAGEMDRPRGLFSFSSGRKDRIEALGDANPPHMAEVIGRAILAGEIAFSALAADCQGRDVR